MMYSGNLILEGGGMRGVYTGGVLEYFMERDLYFSHNYGVSMGACQGMSYISRQPGRNKVVTVDLASHKEYMKLTGLIDGRGLFNREFIFDDIPNHLVKFDYESFLGSDEVFYVVITNCETGKAEYINLKTIKSKEEMMSLLVASSSLPFIANPVRIGNQHYMDGGLADSIPIRHCYNNGIEKHVVILTREKNYQKSITDDKKRVTRFIYKKYPNLVKAIEHRNEDYNESRAVVNELADLGKIYAIYPREPLPVSRTDREYSKLFEAYNLGYNDGRYHYERIIEYLER